MYLLAFLILFAHSATAADTPGSACGKTVSKVVQTWSKVAASSLGGENKCAEIDPAEVQQLACKKDITVNARDLGNISAFVTGEWAEEGVFQIVARRSEAKIQCRNTAFENYLKNSTKSEELNQKAAANFEKVKEDLQILTGYREELTAELGKMKAMYSDPRIAQAGKGNLKAQEKKIAETQQAIALAITQLPMGSEPEVARGYEKMASAGKFDESLLRDSIAQGQKKYLDAIKFYFDHSQPLDSKNMLYCLDEKYRSFAVKSGASSSVMNEVLPKGSKLKSKINCRFNATYGVGADRLQIVQAGAMLASMAFWGTEMAAAKGFQWAKAAASSRGLALSAQALNAVVAVSQIQMACFNDVSTSTIATEADQTTCDPEKESKKVVNESDNSYCAAALAWNSTYLAPHVLNYLNKFKSARGVLRDDVRNDMRAAAAADDQLASLPYQKKFGPFTFHNETIKTRFDSVEALKAKGYKFANETEHVKNGQALELAGIKDGSELEKLVYQINNKYQTKVFLQDDLQHLGSSGSKQIFLRKSYALSNPDDLKAVLFHETKHASADWNSLKPNSPDRDRLIEFFSDDHKLPAPTGYQGYMRADEVEARLTQIAKHHKDGKMIEANVAAEQAKQMAAAQKEILASITPAQISKARMEYVGTKGSKYGIKINRYGSPLFLNFQVVHKGPPTQKQISDQIRARLKYLSDIEKRIDIINSSPDRKSLMRMRK